MSTFGVMKARIATEMQRSDISASSTAVQNSVLTAISRLERRRFHWNEFNNINATVSASLLPIANITALVGGRPIIFDSVKMIINQRDYRLIRTDWATLDSIDSGQWTGFPEYYAIHSDSIRFYPPPLSDFGTRISGTYALPEISAAATTGATNAWMTEGEEMVRQLSKSIIWEDIYQDAQAAEFFSAKSERAYRELRKEIVAKTASGRIRPTIF